MIKNSNETEDSRRFAESVVRRLQEAGHEAFFAGGCVRDLLLNRIPKDYDVATSASPEVVQSLFRNTIAIGKSFGVIQVRGGRNLGVEVATFRADGEYTDGRRPSTVRFTDAREDALRRDFTINGMFFDPINEQVLDFVGGKADLQRRIIRAIGEPEQRFREDKLRLLRTIRFTARLGFSVDASTLDAVKRLAPTLSVVSGERMLAELRLLMDGRSRGEGMELLFESNLAGVVFAEAGDSWRPLETRSIVVERIRSLPDDAPLGLSLAVVFDVLLAENRERPVEGFFGRLKAPNADRELCEWLLRHRDDLADVASRPLSFRKRRYADLNWRWLTAFGIARGFSAEVDWCENERRSLRPDEIDPEPLVTGDDLTREGLTPGPRFKVWLERLRDLQLDGDVVSKNDAIHQVKEWSKATP